MSTMTDRDVIAWARRYSLACARTGNTDSAEKYRRLADLAEKGAEDWQPIVTAPMGTRVILGGKGLVFTGEVAYARGPVDEDGSTQTATHWRPLPAAPGGER